MCAKKLLLGLPPADRPKEAVTETTDDLFKLEVKHIDYNSLGFGCLGEAASATTDIQAECKNNDSACGQPTWWSPWGEGGNLFITLETRKSSK